MKPLSSREPVFNIPWIVVGLLAAMAVIQGVRDLLPDQVDADLLARFAFVPGRLIAAVDPEGLVAHWSASLADGRATRESVLAARFFLGDGSLQPWTPLTYALLHGGWTHLGLNAVWLVAFGTPVARRLGPWRFMLFMAAGALCGAAAHDLVDRFSLQPLVGASAAVSACMAGALRFMFQAPRLTEEGVRLPADTNPRVSLRAMVRDRRAVTFLVVWLLTNVATGIAAVPLGMSDAPIAWQAHIGGFLLGLLAFPLFDRPASPPVPPAPTPA